MNEKIKSPSGQGGTGGGGNSGNLAISGGNGGGNSISNTQSPHTPPHSVQASVSGIPSISNNEPQTTIPTAHLYGPSSSGDPAVMVHYHMHQQLPHLQHMLPHPGPGSLGVQPLVASDHPGKDEYGQVALSGPLPPPPGGHHPVYGRYHHSDPSLETYRYAHSPMQQPPPTSGKHMGSGSGSGISSPGRLAPQRYLPGQPPQGPMPTLNSLLQSSHPPPQHRYTNNYDPQHPQQAPPPQSQQAHQSGGNQQHPQPGGSSQSGPQPLPLHSAPSPHQVPYTVPQTGWVPPPRPYSPQLGPSPQYRTPPPANTSRGQSPYPPNHGQNPASYPSSPQQVQQQSGGNSGNISGPPPPPQSSNQGTTPSQYSPYPQRYPTPPGPGPAVGPNHRTAYSTHQYPEPNRPWPSGSSPAASPGPGTHPLPPASPHHVHGGGPQPNSSPNHAPSPSPQPSQASPSPHQELIGQNSNDSASGGVQSGIGAGPPGTPNSQQVTRPTPSPTGSSGSRSMSPAVVSHSISRPSSNHSSSMPLQQQQQSSIGPPHASQSTSQQNMQGAGVANATSTTNNTIQHGIPGNNSSSTVTHQPSAPPNQNIGNLSNLQTQGNSGSGVYALPPHMHGSYKIGSQSSGSQALLSGYPLPPPQQTQQYSQGNYPPRPQYPPSSYGPASPSNQSPSVSMQTGNGPQPYSSGRPMPNHSNCSPYPPYQNWVPPTHQGASPSSSGIISPSSSMGNQNSVSLANHVQGKVASLSSQSGSSPRPLNYLKQHLQHKSSYTSNAPQNFGNGSGMHASMSMGPPHHMGPPHGLSSMGPPTSTPQSMLAANEPCGPVLPEHISQENCINSSVSASSSSGLPHPITSIVTTGPDGTSLDEASQQSTLSNASAASGEDPQCVTPKSRKNDPYPQSHLPPPNTSPAGLVGAGTHLNHPSGPVEEYELNSPTNWVRTPSSPNFSPHAPQQDVFRSTGSTPSPIAVSASKKSDSLCKLYEMDDNPERRLWLDKLRVFMDERRTPITACPTISKQPLDLFRLYLYVKERGGFVEVTKSKTWKDIAGLLGIGASSSAAYTLRKHYTKNLLAFECHYDRGDIDPLPIIQQVEAGTKKKSTKATSVPSPAGSSNSQDSFPTAGGAGNASIDGYPSYAGGYASAGPQGDYVSSGQISRPPSQNNQNSHPGSPYPAQSSVYGQYAPGDQYNTGGQPAQFGQQQGQFPTPNRNIYPPYGSDGEAPPSGSNQYGPYGNRPYSQPNSGGNQAPTPPGPTTGAIGVPSVSGPTATGGNAYPHAGSAQQDYYRPPEQSAQPRRHPDFVKDSQPYPNYNARPQLYGGWQNNTGQYRGQYPSSPSPQAWVNAPPRTSSASPSVPVGLSTQQTSTPNSSAQWEPHRYQHQPQPPPQPQSQQQQTPPQWVQMSGGNSTSPATSGGAAISPLRPPSAGQQRLPPSVPVCMSGPTQSQPNTVPNNANSGSGILPAPGISKPSFTMPPPISTSSNPPVPAGSNSIQSVMGVATKAPPISVSGSVTASSQQQQQQTAFPQFAKKEIVFPADSVEATTAVVYRRKRLMKADVCPIDPWRIFMAMRSGLLTECTWALDILNVLLFDDSTVQYFGLAYLPGLLTLLLEHFQKNLADMFCEDAGEDYKLIKNDKNGPSAATTPHLKCNNACKDLKSDKSISEGFTEERNNDSSDSSVGNKLNEEEEDIDLGQVRSLPTADERILLLPHTPNYTMMSRKGLPVRLQSAEQDIFVTNDLRPWDVEYTKNYEDITSFDSNAWTFGYTDPFTNAGIIDVFKSEFIDIPFAHYIKTCNAKLRLNNKLDKINQETTTNLTTDKTERIEKNKDEQMDSVAKQETFSKKRRHLNNTNLNSDNDNRNEDSDESSFEIKKTKLQTNDKQQVFNQIQLKQKDDQEVLSTTNNTDSDCREIDMDLETISGLKEKTTQFDPKSTARDPAAVLQRRRFSSSLEDECYTRDESSLYLVNESQDSLARRCICISNIFRNLSFVPGNEIILAKSPRFLAVLGKLLLLYHEHLPRPPKNRNYDRSTEEGLDFSDSCSSLQGEKEWWWDYLISIRENMLVIIANIAGHLELSRYEELIARPLIDGLLHWAVCPSAHGQDPFPSNGPTSSLSPQRLALEALCKLCVTDNNVDLVIATPPFVRLEKLCAVLTRHLCRNEDQVLREFSVNLLHYLAAADSVMARTVALQSPCISYLVAFIEQAEQTALSVANQHGINYLRENPDSMGTSLDMLRRAAGTLLHLAKHPDNRSLFMQQEQRLIGLVMSHILDQQVALIISRVLFQVSRGSGTSLNSLEYRLQQKLKKSDHIDKHLPTTIDMNNKEVLPADVKEDVKMKMVVDTVDTIPAALPTNNCESNQSTSVDRMPTDNKPPLTTTSSSISNAIITADSENSNSNSQITPTAAFNDVSNSSTNSSSCGTGISAQSNVSNNSSNSSSNQNALTNNVGHNSSTPTYAHSNNISSAEHFKNNILNSVTTTNINTPATTLIGMGISNSSSTSAQSQASPSLSVASPPTQTPNASTTAAVA